MSELTFREGRATDLEAVYNLGERAWDRSRAERGLIGHDEAQTDRQLGHPAVLSDAPEEAAQIR